jgi:hypothetical protein
LIKEGTPNTPRSWGESPYNLLDITIKQGHPQRSVDKTKLTFLTLLPLMIVVVIYIKNSRLKRKKEKEVV